MFLGLALSVVNESTIICWHRSIKTHVNSELFPLQYSIYSVVRSVPVFSRYYHGRFHTFHFWLGEEILRKRNKSEYSQKIDYDAIIARGSTRVP